MVDSMSPGDESDDEDNTAGDEMLSRSELRKAFLGIPKFNQHSVEDFLYLFQLNHDGQASPQRLIVSLAVAPS